MSSFVTSTAGFPELPKRGNRTRAEASGWLFDLPISVETARANRVFSDSPRSAARAFAFLMSSGGSSTVVRIKA